MALDIPLRPRLKLISFIKKERLALLDRAIKSTQNEEVAEVSYIVQGKVADEGMLQQMEMRANQALMQQIQRAFFTAPENKEYLERLQKAQTEKDQVALQSLSEEVQPLLEARMEEKKFSYTEEQKAIYKEIGGTPFLDQQYTVFGEVIEGLDIVDKIAAVEKDGERPVKDIKMTVTVID